MRDIWFLPVVPRMPPRLYNDKGAIEQWDSKSDNVLRDDLCAWPIPRLHNPAPKTQRRTSSTSGCLVGYKRTHIPSESPPPNCLFYHDTWVVRTVVGLLGAVFPQLDTLAHSLAQGLICASQICCFVHCGACAARQVGARFCTKAKLGQVERDTSDNQHRAAQGYSKAPSRSFVAEFLPRPLHCPLGCRPRRPN